MTFIDIEVGKASLDDVPGILAVQKENLVPSADQNALKLGELAHKGFLLHPLGSQELEEAFADPDNLVLVAKNGGCVCGYAITLDLLNWKKIQPAWEGSVVAPSEAKRFLRENKVLYLRHIARRPGFDRCGSKVMETLISEAGALGYGAIVAEILQAPAQNRMSTEFHQYHGFKMVGTIRESEVTG
ncbi:MAG: hypothetical protein MUD10_00840 [Candidatus Pacebacteria bacterium]|nr:hypothetical protein [Candidatus Paceibacterota bacterium]